MRNNRNEPTPFMNIRFYFVYKQFLISCIQYDELVGGKIPLIIFVFHLVKGRYCKVEDSSKPHCLESTVSQMRLIKLVNFIVICFLNKVGRNLYT